MPWSTSRYWISHMAASFVRNGKERMGLGCFAMKVLSMASTTLGKEKVSVPGLLELSSL